MDDNRQRIEETLRGILRDTLALDAARVAGFRADTALFGALPELDSMAVAGLLTELEDRLGIVIDDDDLDGDLLGTFGALADYAVAKVGD